MRQIVGPTASFSLAERHEAEGRTPQVSKNGTVIPFPPHRDLKLVAKLIQKYLALVKKHGEDAYLIHAKCNEKPIVARLMRYGLTIAEARAEVSRVQEAMAAMSLDRQTERSLLKAGGR